LARFSMLLDHGGDGDVDAALEVHRVHAGGDGLGAFAHDRLREHGGGGGAVAGIVSLVLEATSRSICAPMFSNLSVEFDLLGDGDAVLGDGRGAPKLLSITTLRPFGPSVKP
jgi:hypothetical protein